MAMQQILDEHPCNDNYGAPRMQLALRQRGIEAGIRRITRIMRKRGWLHTRRRPKGLTKVDPEAMVSENLLKQDFSADEPYKKLLTDITQTPCLDGKLYISPILDCYNGEVLSLMMRNNMKKELCMDTVKALSRFPVSGAILHSDRGSQYTSGGFRETLEKMGLKQSLSGVAHCYDNASLLLTLPNLIWLCKHDFIAISYACGRAELDEPHGWLDHVTGALDTIGDFLSRLILPALALCLFRAVRKKRGTRSEKN